MKKVGVFLVLGLIAVGLAAAQTNRGGVMYVAVRQLPLKTSGGFFANTGGTLDYGARVTVLQTSGKFAEIRCTTDSSLKGWVPSANLSRQNLSREENPAEAENTFRNRRNMNFAEVDKVEAIPVNEFYLKMFIEEGRLFLGDNQ